MSGLSLTVAKLEIAQNLRSYMIMGISLSMGMMIAAQIVRYVVYLPSGREIMHRLIGCLGGRNFTAKNGNVRIIGKGP